ncbi:MAG TPA: tRNA (adenosine(37)-N6)-threonylcarbamoyltransferase complex dimerization subunit type 1 TsaB [Fluviicola sp.]|nr:tRNA (adenosine(37)-N6)-threonylcarbamoyltransferase complex dimerization subunit type 1 TsaB [Fluviicola sp.]
MTRILHLETATKVCSVAISENGKLIDFTDTNDDAFTHGEELTVFIDELLLRNNMKATDLQAVSVSAGPGSYTGLRIGVSTAKGICYALNIPLIAVDSLLSMVEMAREKHPLAAVCPMIDARRMEVFSLIYNLKSNTILKPSSADVLDAQTYAEYEPFVCFGDGASKLVELWKLRSVQFDSTILPSARGQVQIAFSKFQANDIEDLAYFEPAYLKEFYQAPVSQKK